MRVRWYNGAVSDVPDDIGRGAIASGKATALMPGEGEKEKKRISNKERRAAANKSIPQEDKK